MSRNAKTFAEVCALVSVLLLCFAPSDVAGEQADVPVSGAAPPRELHSLDTKMQQFVSKWNVPGASVAVMRGGRLLFSRGYGYSDLSSKKPIDPEHSMFRIASVSKPITSAATLRLVQDGKLGLDDRVFDILQNVRPDKRAKVDPRIWTITIRDLLNMSAGWDKQKSGDPMLQPTIAKAAHKFKHQGPADFETTARYMMGRRLDFNPGTKFAYSNFTYGLLGKVIEKVSGQSYQDYVRTALFEPSGVQLYQGHTRKEDRLLDEVAYYAPLERKAKSFLPTKAVQVEAPYARAYLEADLPMIGWVATAPELAKLMDRVLSDEQLLSKETRDQMTSRPPLSCWNGRKHYFSMGWEIVPDRSGQPTLYKDGTLPGTRAFVEHTPDGITWVALFNSRPPQKQPDAFALQIKQMMAGTVDAVSERRTVNNGAVPAVFDFPKLQALFNHSKASVKTAFLNANKHVDYSEVLARDVQRQRDRMTCDW